MSVGVGLQALGVPSRPCIVPCRTCRNKDLPIECARAPAWEALCSCMLQLCTFTCLHLWLLLWRCWECMQKPCELCAPPPPPHMHTPGRAQNAPQAQKRAHTHRMQVARCSRVLANPVFVGGTQSLRWLPCIPRIAAFATSSRAPEVPTAAAKESEGIRFVYENPGGKLSFRPWEQRRRALRAKDVQPQVDIMVEGKPLGRSMRR